MQTPVALILYNRPELTARVFAAIRRAQPARLLLIADGPRSMIERPDDSERCAAARAVVNQVDWDCQVLTNYADHNLGVRQRVDSGLAWVFSRVDAAIVLEDDCLPDPTFFTFCEQMLERYLHDERVMAISGNNFLRGRYQPPASYYFSRYPLSWGWATWRRAWQRYDPAMQRWPGLRDGGWLTRLLDEPAAVRYWTYQFQKNYETRENWDYAWIYSCWLQGGLTIAPSVNLVSNIGFHLDATHTRDPRSPLANLPAVSIPLPLRHPARIERDHQADALTEQTAFSGTEFLKPLFAAARAALQARRPV
jgi:hypothetical protein